MSKLVSWLNYVDEPLTALAAFGVSPESAGKKLMPQSQYSPVHNCWLSPRLWQIMIVSYIYTVFPRIVSAEYSFLNLWL